MTVGVIVAVMAVGALVVAPPEAALIVGACVAAAGRTRPRMMTDGVRRALRTVRIGLRVR